MQILNAMIVDSHSDLRSGIQSALKKHGIQSMSFDKIGSMIKYINQSGEYPELIVTCTETENNSVLTILAMILKKHEMRHTMVSLIYSSEEDWYLPIAFELGLLSAHQKPMNQLKMEKEFDRLKELLDNPDHGRTLTAYHYLRDHLSRKEHFHHLIQLEENLVKIFQKPYLFINLAESLSMAGHFEEAKRTLLQAKFQHHSLTIAVKQLNDLFEEDFEEHTKSIDFSNVFNLGACYIIDQDQVSANHMIKSLEELNIPKIVHFDQPENFLKMKEEENNKMILILMEWKFHSMSGHAFLHQLYKRKTDNYIIVVVSSVISKEDLVLLQEMGVSSHLEKPIQSETLTATLMSVIRNDRFPSDSRQLVAKFQKASSSKNLLEMKNIYKILSSGKKISVPKMMTLQAEIMLMENNLEGAKELVMKAVRSGEKDLLLFNLMGNLLLKLGDKKSAMVCFDKASSFSPNNFARICKVADICIDIGDKQKSEEMLAQAKAIDSENDQVKSLNIKKSIIAEDFGQASEIIGEIESLTSLVSMMNNRAVILAQSGKTEESIKTYINTLKVIPKDRKEEKLKLYYNLALAFARQGEYEKASKIIEKKISKKSPSKIYKKSESLLHRLKAAIQSGKSVSFNFVSTTDENISAIDQARPVAVDMNPGEYQLHKIFNADDFIDQKVSEKLNFSRNFLTKSSRGQIKED